MCSAGGKIVHAWFPRRHNGKLRDARGRDQPVQHSEALVTRVQVSTLDPAQFELGVRCAECGSLLVAPWGQAVERIWERRAYALPLDPEDRETDDPEEVAWVWELICAECAGA